MDSRGVRAAGAVALVDSTRPTVPVVPAWEERWFHRMNAPIGAAERPVWVVMQMGNGLAAVAIPLAIRAAGHPWERAVRVGVAGGGAWQLAKAVKAVVRRGRPTALVDGVVLRDGDPDGYGFVSGHVAVATSIAIVGASFLPRWQAAVLAGGAATVAFARVHVGAHLPLDVAGAIALAVVWSSPFRVAKGEP